VAAVSVATVARKVAGLFSPRSVRRPVRDRPPGGWRPRRKCPRKVRRAGIGPPRPAAGSAAAGCTREGLVPRDPASIGRGRAGSGRPGVLGAPVPPVVGLTGAGAVRRATSSAATAEPLADDPVGRTPATRIAGIDRVEATALAHARCSAKAVAAAVDDARRTAAATASARRWAARVSRSRFSARPTGGLGAGGVVKASTALAARSCSGGYRCQLQLPPQPQLRLLPVAPIVLVAPVRLKRHDFAPPRRSTAAGTPLSPASSPAYGE